MKIVAKSIRNGIKVKQTFIKPEGMTESTFQEMVRDWVFGFGAGTEVKSIKVIENY